MNDYLFLACVLIGWMFICTTLILCACAFSSQLSQQENEGNEGEVYQPAFLEPIGVGLSVIPVFAMFELEAE